jgi:hypothetical protein
MRHILPIVRHHFDIQIDHQGTKRLKIVMTGQGKKTTQGTVIFSIQRQKG